MGISPQEGRYTKLGVLVALVGVVVAYLDWQHPRAARVDSQPAAQGTPAPAVATVTPAGEPDSTPATPTPSPPPETPQPPRPDPGEPVPTCRAPEPATLRADSTATVAAGLVTLSITPNQLGSERFVTLNMASDRESRTEMVLGAPDRYRLETSLGPYFVNVTHVDFESSTLKVQVGCERVRSAE